jgi:tRNA1Val (adenine37-N6)-methyltransferase
MMNDHEEFLFDPSACRMDDLQSKGLVLFQDPNDFCFGTDAVLLADFAAKKMKASSVVLDLCSGNGVIPLLLYARQETLDITGMEIQPKTCGLAQYNIAYNHLEDRIRIICGDLNELPKTMYGRFDCVTVNPPYIPVGHGIVSKTAASAARHEITANLEDVLRASALALKDKGMLFLVHKPHRTAEIITKMQQYRLQPKTLRFVHPKADEKANMVLIAAAKNAGVWVDVLPPLILYRSDGTPTEELNEIYGGESRS